MLSKLFTSARRFVSKTPEPESITGSQDSREQKDREMVRTRRQAQNAAEQESSQVEASGSEPQTSSVVLDTVETTSIQEDLPVRAKAAQTTIEVVIPVSKLPGLDVKDSGTQETAEGEESHDTKEEDKKIEHASGQSLKRSVLYPQITVEAATPAPLAPTPKMSSNKRKSHASALSSSIKAPESPATSSATPSRKASRHKRYGSEEPEPVPIIETPVEQVEDSENSDDDSDDAPEEFTKETATKTLKAQDREAKRAIEAQKAVLTKKRKDRAELLRGQAEAADKKRKRSEKSKGGPHNPKKARLDDEASDDEAAETTTPKFSSLRGGPLPEFLPSEFLQDNDPEPEWTSTEVAPLPNQTKPKKTKFADLLEKKPRDRKKGSTTFRVVEKTSSLFPPKTERWAADRKAQMIQGRNREPFTKGFFKK